MKYDIVSAPSYSLVELSLNSGESVIVEPGAMAWMDPSIKPKTEINELVQNLDFAPTFLDYANISIPNDIQGLSFRKLFTFSCFNQARLLSFNFSRISC